MGAVYAGEPDPYRKPGAVDDETDVEQAGCRGLMAPSGLLVVDKPTGRWTSHDVVGRVRRIWVPGRSATPARWTRWRRVSS